MIWPFPLAVSMQACSWFWVKMQLTRFLCWGLLTVFGMNVGGVPWTGQRDPALKNGFRNVLLLCVAMLFLVLLCFSFPAIYTRLASWQRRRALRRSWSLNRRSFLKRTTSTLPERGGYHRIWREWHNPLVHSLSLIFLYHLLCRILCLQYFFFQESSSSPQC